MQDILIKTMFTVKWISTVNSRKVPKMTAK